MFVKRGSSLLGVSVGLLERRLRCVRDLERMAAPKSLLPEATCARVSGTMDDSVILRMLDTRSTGECVLVILGRINLAESN